MNVGDRWFDPQGNEWEVISVDCDKNGFVRIQSRLVTPAP